MERASYVLDLNMLPPLIGELLPLLDMSFLSTGGLSPLLDSTLAGEVFAMAGEL